MSENIYGRVLFVELIGGIGDLLMALPAIRAIRRAHRASQMTVFTFAPGSSLLEGDPDVAEVIVAPRGPDGPDGPPAKPILRRLLESRAFDLVVSTTRYAGIHELIEGLTAGRAVTHLWRGTHPGGPVERAFLRRLVEEGIIHARHQTTPLTVHVDPADAAWADRWWSDVERLIDVPAGRSRTVVLNPHAGMPIKRWPAGHFVALARRLRARGCEVAIVPDGEDSATEEIADAAGGLMLPFVGLRRLAALLRGAGAFVSADSGPAKLAAGVGVPVVTLFGPTWAGRYGQVGPHRNLQSPFSCPVLNPMNFTEQPCWWSGRCIFADKTGCVEDVEVERVARAVADLLPDAREVGRPVWKAA